MRQPSPVAERAEQDEFHAWRALSARAKADHVAELCAASGVQPGAVVEIGCGDGALLAELRARGFGVSWRGFDVDPGAVAAAVGRGIEAELYDGAAVPLGECDLVVMSHVLEHVADPSALLREAARLAPWVLVEVPLEANASARRPSKREISDGIGHVQALDRDGTRALVEGAGLRIAGDLLDPLGRDVIGFFARTPAQRAAAGAKWAVRRASFAVSPTLAQRAFTLHYALLAARA